MSVTFEELKTKSKLKFCDEMTICYVSGINDELQDLWSALEDAKHMPLDIDLRQVSDIDSAGLQIVLSLQKSLLAEDHQMGRLQHSESTQSLFDLYQIDASATDK